jgi:hypothetical protein
MLTKILRAGFCLFFLLVSASLQAENEYWQSLDGPYWVKGIDIAYGAAGEGRAWHRYLIGNDGNYTKLFY